MVDSGWVGWVNKELMVSEMKMRKRKKWKIRVRMGQKREKVSNGRVTQ